MASELAPEVLNQALMGLSAGLNNAKMTGAPVNWTRGTGYFMSPGSGGGSSFTAQPGDTVGALAAAAGMSTADFAAQYGISNPNMIIAGQSYSGGGGGELVQSQFWAEHAESAAGSLSEAEISAEGIADDMATATDTLQSGVDAVFGKTYTLNIDLSALAGLIAAAVAGNGGITPGSSNFTSRGSTGAGGGSGAARPRPGSFTPSRD